MSNVSRWHRAEQEQRAEALLAKTLDEVSVLKRQLLRAQADKQAGDQALLQVLL